MWFRELLDEEWVSIIKKIKNLLKSFLKKLKLWLKRHQNDLYNEQNHLLPLCEFLNEYLVF